MVHESGERAKSKRGLKTCTSCNEDKPRSEFYRRKNCSDGINSHCKSCENKEIKAWRENNPDKQALINRRTRLKTVYGITPEQYDELLDKQNGCCAICERSQDEFKTRLAVDHNHSSGEIRGLLCNYCNHRVIGRHKDGELLRKMANYVDGGTGLFVPEEWKTGKKRRAKRPRKVKNDQTKQ